MPQCCSGASAKRSFRKARCRLQIWGRVKRQPWHEGSRGGNTEYVVLRQRSSQATAAVGRRIFFSVRAGRSRIHPVPKGFAIFKLERQVSSHLERL
jgi:hypothetical protein